MPLIEKLGRAGAEKVPCKGSRLHSREKSIVIRNIQAAIGRQLRAELEVTDPVSEHLAELLRQLAQPQDPTPTTRPSSRPTNIAPHRAALYGSKGWCLDGPVSGQPDYECPNTAHGMVKFRAAI